MSEEGSSTATFQQQSLYALQLASHEHVAAYVACWQLTSSSEQPCKPSGQRMSVSKTESDRSSNAFLGTVHGSVLLLHKGSLLLGVGVISAVTSAEMSHAAHTGSGFIPAS